MNSLHKNAKKMSQQLISLRKLCPGQSFSIQSKNAIHEAGRNGREEVHKD
jgi:hypothetical protein